MPRDVALDSVTEATVSFQNVCGIRRKLVNQGLTSSIPCWRREMLLPEAQEEMHFRVPP